MNGKKNKGKPQSFAFLEFETKEITEKNFNELQHKKVKTKEIIVDYVGEKSSYVKKAPKNKDLKRLHITGFGKGEKNDELIKLFPNHIEFVMPVKTRTNLTMG